MAKKPTGLSITKTGSTFSVSWKRAQDYSDQQCQYSTLYSGGWVSISTGKSATSKSVTVLSTSYVSFRVRGKKSGKWSSWSQVTFWLAVPYDPSVGFSSEPEKTTFSWSQYVDSSIAQDFGYIEYQTAFTSESNAPVWSASAYSGSASDNIPYTEDSSVISTGSHSRWFRARAVGLGGFSNWVTVRRVYARPNAAVITKAEPTDDASGINGYVAWTTSPSAEYPIDSTTVQYLITIPAEDVSLPSGSPSWQDIGGYSSSKGADAISFETGDTLEDDEVMFVRVNTQHDDRPNYGEAQILKIGYLADAENVSLTDIDPAQFRITVNATNASEVPDSFLVVTHKTKDEEIDLAIIPHGQTSVVVQCPNWSEDQNISFGVRAVVGTAAVVQTRSDGVTIYRVESKMQSKNTIWEGGTLPVLPANVTVEATSISGSIRVGWEWSWSPARYADVSWSDHADAWESTDEPSIYRVNVVHAPYWFIAGLELGKTWYVRVRLVASDGETASPWSPIESIDLSIAPSIPSLTLSASVITLEDVLTAYWSYVTLDGKAQAYAEICEATVVNGVITHGDIIAHTETAQHIDINPKEVGWETGETHRLCVRVVSGAGKSSRDWSVPVSVSIAEPIEAEITDTSLVHEEITVDETTVEVEALKELPLRVTVTGAGNGGTTTVVVERAEDYQMDRPDESELDGYKGETIALLDASGDGEFTIGVNDLKGRLDDGAKYNLIAIVKDNAGQMSEARIDNFEVHWTHQAIVPLATIEADETNLIVKITPIAPEGASDTDVADIYRLSVDKPELVVEGATFGTTYVDPYPALGEMGGYRVVMRTENNDYITEDNMIAWVDEPAGIKNEDLLNIIDFDGRQIKFYYDTDYSHTWTKDFEETQYLGGSIQGDWNPAISRTGTLNTKGITVLDQEMLQDVRRLAEYPGVCHIRTADGSSYSGNIEVSEDRVHDDQEMVASYSLSITRVDNYELDGLTLEQYQAGGTE